MQHSYYSNAPCPACGDLDGCHIPGKVKRHRALRVLNFMADGGCGDEPCQVKYTPFGKTEATEARYGQTYPRKICLCGSSRFKDQHLEAMKRITLNGDIYLAMGCFGHADADANVDMDGPMKQVLDELHKRKIDEADEVFVVNPLANICRECGKPCEKKQYDEDEYLSDCHGARILRKPYIGSSTRSEIEYAQRMGKTVRYLEPVE